jgi:signal peptidase I
VNKYSETIDSILKKAPETNKVSFEVISASMFPALRRGDVVIVNRIDLKEIRVGDIVVQRGRGAHLVHRVIRKMRRKDDTAILTKGDLCLFPDNPAGSEKVIGKVVKVFRNNHQVCRDSWFIILLIDIFILLGIVLTAFHALIRSFDLRACCNE